MTLPTLHSRVVLDARMGPRSSSSGERSRLGTQFRYSPALPFGRMRGLVAVLALLVPFAGGSEAARAPVPRGEIFVVGVDGRGRQNLTHTAAFESEIALSPDGRRIAYVRSEGMRSQVWVMNVDGSGQRRLTSGGDGEFWPQWSPDGRRLAYMVWDAAACTPVSGSGCAVPDVWTVDADGSGQRKVLDSAFQPRWSPDGSKLLFQRS